MTRAVVIACVLMLSASSALAQNQTRPLPTKEAARLDFVEQGRRLCEEQAAFWFVEAQRLKRETDDLRAKLPKEPEPKESAPSPK